MAYADATLTRMRALPGVQSAALASLIPLEGSDQIWGFWIQGRASGGGDGDGSALFYRVSPGYFATIGIPLRAGRDIADADREGGRAVVVVSESLGEKFFPGESPLGKQVRFGRDADEPIAEIVGVVGDVQHYDLGQRSMPQVYVPFRQRPTGDISFVIRTSTPPLDLVDEVRGAVGAVDRDQPLVNVQTLEAMVSDTISTPRFRTLLMTGRVGLAGVRPQPDSGIHAVRSRCAGSGRVRNGAAGPLGGGVHSHVGPGQPGNPRGSRS